MKKVLCGIKCDQHNHCNLLIIWKCKFNNKYQGSYEIFIQLQEFKLMLDRKNHFGFIRIKHCFLPWVLILFVTR